MRPGRLDEPREAPWAPGGSMGTETLHEHRDAPWAPGSSMSPGRLHAPREAPWAPGGSMGPGRERGEREEVATTSSYTTVAVHRKGGAPMGHVTRIPACLFAA